MNNSSPSPDWPVLGEGMYRLMAELFPICRSITGDGLRATLRRLQRVVPLELREVPSGTPVFDWVVPDEWNVRDAYLQNSLGEKVVDFNRSNLHLVNYSVPVRARLSLAELMPHLHALPERPEWIPYRTSYYHRDWGFCLSQRTLEALADGDYDVVIDTTLEPGHLTYGEYVLPGELADEVLISCHCCHPSLCNDNLTGMALAVTLARILGQRDGRRYTYRFLFLPATIGAITWLALHEVETSHIRHGLVVACVGDPGPFTYKQSRRGDAEIDRAVAHVLAHSGLPHRIVPFSPHGYDERQYCSPGFNLPVGRLSRSPHEEYPEYHTSADDLTLVQPDCLAESLAQYLAVIDVLEGNRVYLNLNPKCEPQLGRRGLYAAMGGWTNTPQAQLALLWVLNLSDGQHGLLEIAERSGLPFAVIDQAASALLEAGLLRAGAAGHA